jgi:protein-disulfide isomerase
MARQRFLLLGIAALVAAVAVGVVLAFAGAKRNSSATTPSTTTATQGNQEAALVGVAQSGLRLGSAAAPATLYVFEDPQCPYCRQWSLDSLVATVDEFVKTNRVKLLLRPIEIIGPDSGPGIRAVYAAAQQNKAWNMLEALYQRQGAEQSGWITKDVLVASAKEAHASSAGVLGGLNSAAVTAAWRSSEQLAQQWGVAGTPTFVLVKQLGAPQQVSSASLEPADFTAALRSALK